MSGPEDERPSPSTSLLRRALERGEVSEAAKILSAMDDLYGFRSSGTGREGGNAASGEIGAQTEEGGFVAFYFTGHERALAYARDRELLLAEGEAELFSEEPVALLRSGLERGFAGIVIDPGAEPPTVLTRAHLESMVARVSPAEGTEPPAERRLAPPPHLLDLAGRVRRSPDLPPVVAPDLDVSEARETLRELRHLVVEGRMPAWKAAEIVAYRIPLHVPVSSRSERGLRWPLVVRHPRDRTSPAVAVFADEGDAATALKIDPPVETLRLSGLEAFRWILAAPVAVEDILVYPTPSEAPLAVPDRLALGVLYPHAFVNVDPGRADRVPLDALGELPGARGTKPEVVRALTEGWADLLEVEGDAGTPPDPVERGGRRYLPVFTSPAAAREYREAHRPGDAGASIARASEVPPFRRWLIESASLDGVILDPGGRTPLPLDSADLAVLALWSESGRQPDGPDLVGLVAEEGEALGPRTRGRILADWPRYYWAVHPGSDEGSAGTLTLPGRDACPVFSAEEGIRDFLDHARGRGLSDPEVQPLLYLTSWAFNVFGEMRTRYRDGGWIDPAPEILDGAPGPKSGGEDVNGEPPPTGAGSGVPVSGDTLRSALARIEWRLQPRVPRFLARE